MESRAMRSEEEIERAMRRHGSAVYVVALAQTRSREDAQDVAQDVFVSLLTCGKSFRDDDHLRAWLLRATVNRCTDVYRSPWKRKVQAMPEGEPDIGGMEAGPEDAALRALERTQALKRLPESLRATAVLFYIEEHSVREIADIMECRQGTVRVRLARARKQMRDVLEGTDEPSERGGAYEAL